MDNRTDAMPALGALKISKARALLLGTALVSVLLTAERAQAQTILDRPSQATPADAAPVANPSDGDAPQSDKAQSDIIVSGSRVQRDGYNSPTPTTVVGEELLTARAPSTIVNALATLPAFKQNATPSTSTNSVGLSQGQSLINLRGLGPIRTLVLLGGQRIVPSNANGSVDVAILPASLIDRIDVVTGGASAAYGSDAVAGVVNFALATRFRGLKGETQFGIADRGDGALKRGTLTAGVDVTERLGIVVSGEYYDNEGVYPQQRSRTATQIIANPAYAVGNGQYRLTIQPNIYYSSATFGGLITNGPLRGQQFNPDGTLSPQIPGTFVGAQTYSTASEADLPFTPRTGYFSAPQTRKTGYGRATYEVVDGVNLYADLLYARSDTTIASSAPNTILIGALTIQTSNPFLPAAVRTTLTNAGVTSFTFGRTSQDLDAAVVDRTNETIRYSAGVDAKLGSGWSVNAYFAHGKNKARTDISNNLITTRYREAIDAVASNGQIVCRSTLTNPGNGCVPLNQFGVRASYSDAQRAYITGTSTARLDYVQDAAALTINGEPFSTWAGPVSVAVGGEYRHERATQAVDALSAASMFQLGNPKALNGVVKVKEAFAETVVPLAKDATLIHSLELNGAVRLTDYSTSGSVTTWKAGATYVPVDGVTLRGTRSRDIRAPNIIELFSSTVQTTVTIIDQATNATAQFPLLSRGNPSLQPERADTLSGGVVLQPRFLPGFGLSVDYYRIKIADAINTLTTQQIVDRCFAGEQALCGLITRDGANRISSITNQFLNLQSIKTSGVDIDASYRRRLSDIVGGESGGYVSLRAIGSYLERYKQSDGVTTLDTTGSLVAAQPRWSWTYIGGYNDERFSTFATVTRIGGGKYDSTLTGAFDISPQDQSIDGVTYLDLAFAFKVPVRRGFVEFYMNVDNVFDKKPPDVFSYAGGPNYDLVGRYFKSGVRFKF